MTLDIHYIRERKAAIEKELSALNKAEKALQALCPHPEHKPAGHDSHYSYEECVVCGLTRSY